MRVSAELCCIWGSEEASASLLLPTSEGFSQSLAPGPSMQSHHANLCFRCQIFSDPLPPSFPGNDPVMTLSHQIMQDNLLGCNILNFIPSENSLCVEGNMLTGSRKKNMDVFGEALFCLLHLLRELLLFSLNVRVVFNSFCHRKTK